MTNYEELLKRAKEVSKNAYTPYSKFNVGACVLAESGNMYVGCNFENSSYGMSICAERNAIQNAISHGDREFEAIAVVGKRKDSKDFDNTLTPCGICLQYIIDMCRDIDIICYINGVEVARKVDYFLNTPFDLAEK